MPRSASSTPAVAFSPDRVIVEWAPGAGPAARRAARAEAEVAFTRDLGSRRFQLVETEPGQTPREAIRELEADPAVVLAERDGYYTEDAIPDDPLFDQLWGLRNSGGGVAGFASAVAGADIGVLGAWERAIGAPSTVVAVIDGGYRFEHPDLANVAWTNPDEIPGDGLDNDGNGIIDDVHGADFVGANGEVPTVDGDPTDDDLYSGGHGVHTAGTIGAQGNNGIGITGVAQDIRLMPLRVCSRYVNSEDRGCPHSAMIGAINYAGEKGAMVANMSFGGTGKSAAVADAIAANPGTLFVASAGNESSNNEVTPKYPCNYEPASEGGAVDNLVCVAATDQADRLANFSNWGRKAVDLGAPGTETLSTYVFGDVFADDFEADDFAARWEDSGADGGFTRTTGAPLTSFGISASALGPPPAGAEIASTSVPITLEPGYKNCFVEATSFVSGAYLMFEVLVDDELIMGVGSSTGHDRPLPLLDQLDEGGKVSVRFSYTAHANPQPGHGAWVEDVALRCRAKVGEANGYAFLQGTSMAAPHVSGAAALLFSLRPSASVDQVREALLGGVDPLQSLAGGTVAGGRLDAAAAADLLDSERPPPPTLTATKPASPAKNREPRLVGAAQRGTEVAVYANATCSGEPVAQGSPAELAGQGIAVAAAEGAVTQFSAKATDLVPLSSACSAPISYSHEGDSVPPPPPPPDPPAPRGDDPAPPGNDPAPPGNDPLRPRPAPARACVVPKLAGKSLAQAKKALRTAGCQPGTVTKPRPRKGQRAQPLVVRSSTPAAAARRAAGAKVHLRLGPKPRQPRR